MSKRFSRQSKIGWWNQRKLSNTNVMIVGCGGIGSWTALQLCFLGVRKITLVDMDTVEESNLNRQFFYEKEVGSFKTEALASKIYAINKKIKVEIYSNPVEKLNNQIYKNTNFVFDCLDNIKTREYLSAKCWELNIPFIHSACSDVIGEVQLCVKGKTDKMLPYPKEMSEEEDKKSCLDFDPAVCTTNMIVASLQVDKFLDYLVKGETKNNKVSYIRGKGITYG